MAAKKSIAAFPGIPWRSVRAAGSGLRAFRMCKYNEYKHSL